MHPVTMHWQTPAGTPDWNDGRDQRLMISMLFATGIVAALLSVVRMPVAPDLAPITELLVNLIRETPQTQADERPHEVPPPDISAEEHSIEPASDAAPPRGIAPAPANDWDVVSEAAISDYLDGLEAPPSPNPVLDAKRRAFGDRYQPPTHEAPRPIWENAEPDQLGRTVLRSGDCYRVIADPNVGSQDKFHTFDQHIVMCTFYRRLPEELPWVAEIRERYHYLKYPDGIVPEEEERQRAE
ncbi:MAG: hypothetical protein KJO13_09355 [Gammaproteobacteria bacterium]|nr:hypothetical protein [Gammaproteobacteria bacterium]